MFAITDTLAHWQRSSILKSEEAMTARPFIVFGDHTDHGGVVIEASQTSHTHGKGIARVGDQVTCPKRGHGTTVIVTGDPTMVIDGKPAARHGDKCACGATLISSQAVSTVGGTASSSPQAAGAQQGPASPAPLMRVDDATGLLVLDYPATAAEFDDKFKLLDDESGQALRNTEYAIKRASGSLEHGVTDDQGHTHLLSSTAATETVDIYV